MRAVKKTEGSFHDTENDRRAEGLTSFPAASQPVTPSEREEKMAALGKRRTRAARTAPAVASRLVVASTWSKPSSGRGGNDSCSGSSRGGSTAANSKASASSKGAGGGFKFSGFGRDRLPVVSSQAIPSDSPGRSGWGSAARKGVQAPVVGAIGDFGAEGGSLTAGVAALSAKNSVGGGWPESLGAAATFFKRESLSARIA